MDRARAEQLYAYPDTSSAWLRVNFVSSLDGSATTAAGVSGDLGGEVDRETFALLRSLADVIVVGAGTARAEGYRPVGTDEVDAELRERLGLSPVPPIAVVTRTLDVPEPLVAPGQLVIAPAASDASRRAELAESVDVIATGDEAIDWPAALDALAARGLRRVLCEGGPSLFGTLVEQGVVDDLCLTIAPTLVAGNGPRISHGEEAVDRPMALAHAEPVGDVILTRWTRA